MEDHQEVEHQLPCVVYQHPIQLQNIHVKRRDSPKVATMDKIEAGKKKVYCRCWQSGTFPLCDGTHMEHNKETGDNVGPLIVSVEKAE